MDKVKSNGASPFPHLLGAFFCEKVLTEADGVISAIRIVDIVQIPPNLPKDAHKRVLLTNLVFVLMIRAGKFRGKATWEIYMVNPSGKRIKAAEQEVDFVDSPEKGINVAIPAAFKWEKPGLYWFEVYLNKRRMTRSPLLIRLAAKPKTEDKKSKD